MELINNLNVHGYKDYQVIQCSAKSCVMMGLDKNNKKVLLKYFIKESYNSHCFMVLPNMNMVLPKELFFLHMLNGKKYVPKILGYYDKQN